LRRQICMLLNFMRRVATIGSPMGMDATGVADSSHLISSVSSACVYLSCIFEVSVRVSLSCLPLHPMSCVYVCACLCLCVCVYECTALNPGGRLSISCISFALLLFNNRLTSSLALCAGHFKLATLVQYVPLPVVGGYLGYVGYFCLAAGVALACGVEVDTFPSWANLFAKEPAIKFVPTFAATAALYLTMNYVAHPLALPAVLMAIPLGFHAVLLATRTTLQEAADLGWVMQPEVCKIVISPSLCDSQWLCGCLSPSRASLSLSLCV
jgi:MFS superfamily sulfate permease-like transporter